MKERTQAGDRNAVANGVQGQEFIRSSRIDEREHRPAIATPSRTFRFQGQQQQQQQQQQQGHTAAAAAAAAAAVAGVQD
jgi:hypothetical protein